MNLYPIGEKRQMKFKMAKKKNLLMKHDLKVWEEIDSKMLTLVTSG